LKDAGLEDLKDRAALNQNLKEDSEKNLGNRLEEQEQQNVQTVFATRLKELIQVHALKIAAALGQDLSSQQLQQHALQAAMIATALLQMAANRGSRVSNEKRMM
jgi:hypothetical protein